MAKNQCQCFILNERCVGKIQVSDSGKLVIGYSLGNVHKLYLDLTINIEAFKAAMSDFSMELISSANAARKRIEYKDGLIIEISGGWDNVNIYLQRKNSSVEVECKRSDIFTELLGVNPPTEPTRKV